MSLLWFFFSLFGLLTCIILGNLAVCKERIRCVCARVCACKECFHRGINSFDQTSPFSKTLLRIRSWIFAPFSVSCASALKWHRMSTWWHYWAILWVAVPQLQSSFHTFTLITVHFMLIGIQLLSIINNWVIIQFIIYNLICVAICLWYKWMNEQLIILI